MHVKGTQVVFRIVHDQVWLILSLLVLAASLEHVSMHIHGTQVMFWTVYDQVWLVLSLLVWAASLKHVQCTSTALRCCSGLFVIKYGSY